MVKNLNTIVSNINNTKSSLTDMKPRQDRNNQIRIIQHENVAFGSTKRCVPGQQQRCQDQYINNHHLHRENDSGQ